MKRALNNKRVFRASRNQYQSKSPIPLSRSEQAHPYGASVVNGGEEWRGSKQQQQQQQQQRQQKQPKHSLSHSAWPASDEDRCGTFMKGCVTPPISGGAAAAKVGGWEERVTCHGAVNRLLSTPLLSSPLLSPLERETEVPVSRVAFL